MFIEGRILAIVVVGGSMFMRVFLSIYISPLPFRCTRTLVYYEKPGFLDRTMCLCDPLRFLNYSFRIKCTAFFTGILFYYRTHLSRPIVTDITVKIIYKYPYSYVENNLAELSSYPIFFYYKI